MALRNYMYAKHGDVAAMTKINKTPGCQPRDDSESIRSKDEMEDIEECKLKCAQCTGKCDELVLAVGSLEIK